MADSASTGSAAETLAQAESAPSVLPQPQAARPSPKRYTPQSSQSSALPPRPAEAKTSTRIPPGLLIRVIADIRLHPRLITIYIPEPVVLFTVYLSRRPIAFGPDRVAHDLCPGSLPNRLVVSMAVRQDVLQTCQMEHVTPTDYELDYLITPELGGAGNAPNLWPQRYDSADWNARVKDDLERLLPRLVCDGTVDLRHGQAILAPRNRNRPPAAANGRLPGAQRCTTS